MRKKKSNSCTEYVFPANDSRDGQVAAGACVGRKGVTGFSEGQVHILSEQSKEQK